MKRVLNHVTPVEGSNINTAVTGEVAVELFTTSIIGLQWIDNHHLRRLEIRCTIRRLLLNKRSHVILCTWYTPSSSISSWDGKQTLFIYSVAQNRALAIHTSILTYFQPTTPSQSWVTHFRNGSIVIARTYSFHVMSFAEDAQYARDL